MVSKIKSSFLCLSFLVFILCGCSSDDDNTNGNNKTGTHKIVLEIESNSDISYIFAFTGANTSGSLARLYDKDGEYQGDTYTKRGTLTEKSTQFICSTSDNGVLLALSLTLSNTQIGSEVTYSLKAYINDKLVDELEKTVKFTEGNLSEMVNFSTTSK